MSPWTEREIARKLAERDDIEPPEGLLEKIKSEIPPVVNVGPRAVGDNVRAFPTVQVSREPRYRRWLIAASLVATVGGGLVALEVMKTTHKSDEAEVVQEPVLQDRDLGAAGPPPAERLSEPGPGTVVAPQAVPDAVPAAPKVMPQAARRDEQEELKSLGYVETPQTAAAPPAAKEKKDAAAQPEPERQKVEDVITVLGETPLLDERRISTGATVNQTELEKIPTARDRRAAQAAPAPEPAPPPPAEVPAGVEGGVVGGVEGGVPGGVVGGVVGGVMAPTSPPPADDSPLRVGSLDKLSQEQLRDNVFQAVGTNPFTETGKDALSTFGLDVDTASYTVARRFLREGRLPDPGSVRVEEFVNFFHYGDPPPARGEFALRAEGAPTPFAPADHRLLRFNLRARDVRPENRKPSVLTFVVDISGSMNMENRLGLVKQSLDLLLGQLRPGDKVGLVVYGDDARVVLEPTADREAVRQATQSLRAEGSTNAEAGLRVGYDLARRFYRNGAINRVILCSDGVANVGATGPDSILERIGREARQGIELTTLGVGMGNYNDVLMEQLADKGDGRYAYIDNLAEARRVLVDEVSGTLQTIAKDAKVQVEFDPKTVARWRLLGYENRLLKHEQFRDNSVDAGEIGAGHSVTALYEVQLKPGVQSSQKIATFRLRFRVPGTGEMRETVRELRVGEMAPSWEKAPQGLRLASLVAELAEVLKGAPTAKEGNLDEVLRRSRKLVAELSTSDQGPDIAEFARLAARAARLKRQGAPAGGH
jgi:Ca-activated chloride channel homolog